MANDTSPPKDPQREIDDARRRENAEAVRKAWNSFLPADDRYRRITIALFVCFSFASIPLYCTATASTIIAKYVYWTWRLTIFGVWSDSSPYFCHGSLCDGISTSDSEPSFLLAAVFLVGALISLRLIVLCLQYLENALGVDLISRALNKYLPGEKNPPK